jgi:flagellar biosynthesis/type III secretory pathway protein FliH
MSGLLKAEAAQASIAIDSLSTRTATRNEERQQAVVKQWADRVAALEKELESRSRTERELREEIKQAYLRGIEEGKAEGLKQANDLQQERLSLLEKTLSVAVKDIQESVRASERLGALLAHDCLDILFADPEQRVHIVTDLIHKQVAQIDPAMVLHVSVSPDDFPDDVVIEELACRVGIPAAHIGVAPQLRSGDAKLHLKLGENDIGLAQQWGRLAQILVQAGGGEL